MLTRSVLVSLITVNSLLSSDHRINPLLSDQTPDLELGLASEQKTSITQVTPRPVRRRSSSGQIKVTKLSRSMADALKALPQESQDRITKQLARTATCTTTPQAPSTVSDELRALNIVMGDSLNLQNSCMMRQQEAAKLQEERLIRLHNDSVLTRKIAIVSTAATVVFAITEFCLKNFS